MGTQLIALAVLCAAIGIVIARLTLRTPRPSVAARHTAGGGAAAATSAAGGTSRQGPGSGKGEAGPADTAAKGGGPASNSGPR